MVWSLDLPIFATFHIFYDKLFEFLTVFDE
jgi:hypothetical protein